MVTTSPVPTFNSGLQHLTISYSQANHWSLLSSGYYPHYLWISFPSQNRIQVYKFSRNPRLISEFQTILVYSYRFWIIFPTNSVFMMIMRGHPMLESHSTPCRSWSLKNCAVRALQPPTRRSSGGNPAGAWSRLSSGLSFRLFALTLSSEIPTWLCRHHVTSVKPQISNFEPELLPQIDGAAAKEHSESIVEAKD